VVFDSAIPEQLGQQGECMVGQHLIDEGFLSLKGFESAAVGDSIVIQGCINYLGKQFGSRAKTRGGPTISGVQRLAEDKLAAVGGVAEVEPVSNTAA
jgi:hypothetical protein